MAAAEYSEILKFSSNHLNIFVKKDLLDNLFKDKHLHYVLSFFILCMQYSTINLCLLPIFYFRLLNY
jgi:hypothetical protein